MTTTDGKAERSSARLGGLSVLMVVANDVSVDSRVQKTAVALAATGAQVTVLGVDEGAEPPDLMGVDVRLLAVDDEMRRAPRSRWRILLDPSDDWLKSSISAERTRFQNHQRDIGAELGWLRRDYYEDRSRRRESARQSQENRNQRLVAQDRTSNDNHGRDQMQRLRKYVERRRKRRSELAEDRRERRFRQMESRIQRQLEREHARSARKISAWRDTLTDGRMFVPTNWRSSLPGQQDLDRAFGPALDSYDPDVVHVHDVHLLGVAARAVGRAYTRKVVPTLIYDAHEYIRGLGTYRPSTVRALAALESEYMPRVDRVIAVSEPLADLLASDHALTPPPAVVMNIPPNATPSSSTVRQAAGVSEDNHLVVYSGGIDPSRGTSVLVDALGLMDERTHLVLVTNTQGKYAETLLERAEQTGFAGRLHLVPFVPGTQVSSFLKDADVAVHPMLAGPINHEVAMPNKLFEYLHAGLPLVVSTCRAMASFVDTNGVGRVFESGEPAALAQAVRAVLLDPSPYRTRAQIVAKEHTWDNQVRTLLKVYDGLAL